jgi:hypothetical protein
LAELVRVKAGVWGLTNRVWADEVEEASSFEVEVKAAVMASEPTARAGVVQCAVPAERATAVQPVIGVPALAKETVPDRVAVETFWRATLAVRPVAMP